MQTMASDIPALPFATESSDALLQQLVNSVKRGF